MDLKRVRAFVTVAEHATVSKAAAILHITQPALSRQIQGFEEELGFRLFVRAGRRLVITSQGEQLLEASRGLLLQAGRLGEQAASIQKGEVRELKVTGSALTIEAMIADFIDVFSARFPDVRLKVIESDPPVQLDMLEKGLAHVAVGLLNVIDENDQRFHTVSLPAFDLVAAFAPELSITGAESIEISQIIRHPLLLLDPSYATRSVFDAACRLGHLRPNVAHESTVVRVLLALARAGHGIAIVPSLLRPWTQGLSTLRLIHQGKGLQLRPGVIWDARRTLPGFVKAFSKLLFEHTEAQFPKSPQVKRKTIRPAGRGRTTR